MGKIIYILQLLVLPLAMSCASAQTNNMDTLKEQLRLLQLPQDFEFEKDTTGFSKFKNSKFYAKNGDVYTIDGNNIHLIDFNNDGLKDIVYQEKRPYTATVLFANNGKDFLEIWNGPGQPVCITQAENTTISVYSSHVGCIEIILLFEVTVGVENKITEDLLSYHHNTLLKKLDYNFKQKVVTGILRATPIEDNTETEDPCTGEQRLGNQIRTIENQKITVIKDKGDWLMVVYKNKNNSIITWIRNK
ncbi:hypothetical protein [Maribacter sp.]|uniref:hypothetical protein n=1 Tax=Maribacter sp. TaxID=1897614 RepID=UPI0025B99606|nr:hypothetical protein [Maribacter sp.]